MKIRLALILFIFLSSLSSAQKIFQFKTFHEFTAKLDSICNLTDETARSVSVNELWDTLKQHNKIPFASGDSVAFLFRGDANSVSWAGDFNSWDPSKGNFKGTRVGPSNIWRCVKSFPAKARLDYKVIVDGNWKPDPDNHLTQYSGVGSTNSELRMPDWVFSEYAIRNPKIPGGKFGVADSIKSTNLGYTVYYNVYTPADYEKLSDLPVIYITDGQEYSDERLGSMITVLDNLIHQKKIKPIVAVFINPRALPNSAGTNRRISEYTINQKFADFVADELVALIDSKYKTNKSPNARAILGTSLGGINSAYFGFYRSDKFHLIAIHSPAFWFKPEIFDDYTNFPKLPLKIFMSTGTINDTQKEALKMKTIFESKGYPLMYVEVPEGHSWGNWRSLMDEPLIYFFRDTISKE